MVSPSRLRIRAGAVLAPLMMVLPMVSGCDGAIQFASGNREIITSLATAVSARNNDWLRSNARLIENRRTEGRLSDAEYETLIAVVAKASAGDWKTAEEDIYSLREAQEPTEDDLHNLEQRKLAPEHSVPRKVRSMPRRWHLPRSR